jgi:valyl-tRNA synthetase
MQLLHPVMPFITEELWQRLTELLGEKPSASIMVSPWPVVDESLLDEAAEREMAMVQSVITVVRTVRNEMHVAPGQKADVVIVPADEDSNRILFDNMGYIVDLGAVKTLTIDAKASKPSKSAAGISDNNQVFVCLSGLIDFESERLRLEKEIDRRKSFIAGIERKLVNQDFLAKAPQEVVILERRKLQDSCQELEKMAANLRALGE